MAKVTSSWPAGCLSVSHGWVRVWETWTVIKQSTFIIVPAITTCPLHHPPNQTHIFFFFLFFLVWPLFHLFQWNLTRDDYVVINITASVLCDSISSLLTFALCLGRPDQDLIVVVWLSLLVWYGSGPARHFRAQPVRHKLHALSQASCEFSQWENGKR